MEKQDMSAAPPPYSQGNEMSQAPPFNPGYQAQPVSYQQQPYMQQYGQTTQTVVSQPGYVTSAPVVTMTPPNNATLAWFSCLCCFWPLGIVAIIKSNEVDAAVARGDLNAAAIASRSARQYSLISIGLGVASVILAIIIIIVFVSVVNVQRSSYGY